MFSGESRKSVVHAKIVFTSLFSKVKTELAVANNLPTKMIEVINAKIS